MRHVPFDGSARPFTIGLNPLDPARWIDVDASLPCLLAQKKALMQRQWDRVFAADADTLGVQAETLDTLLGHLARDHEDHYRVSGERGTRSITVLATGDTYMQADWEHAPLALAGLLIQDDLVIMRKAGPISSSAPWIFVAGSVCFPSFWSLHDKHGRSLEAVHGPVPGVNARIGERINRIFDHMRPAMPLCRQNWSVTPHRALAQRGHKNLARPDAPLTAESVPTQLFLRVEYQTLRKLERSSAVVFTIKVELSPLSDLAAHPDRAALSAHLLEQLQALTPEQRAYKDLDGTMAPLSAWLEEIADPSSPYS